MEESKQVEEVVVEEEQQVEGEVAEEEQVFECALCGQPREPIDLEEGAMPPSKLFIRFAGPGSAQIELMLGEGVVTPEQLGAAGLFLITRAFQEWSVPVVQSLVAAGIATFVKEVNKPRIEVAPANMPPFFIPPGPGGPA